MAKRKGWQRILISWLRRTLGIRSPAVDTPLLLGFRKADREE